MKRSLRTDSAGLEAPLPASGRGYEYVCPACAPEHKQGLILCDTRDGDQAYYCVRCQRGWRAGCLSPAALRPLAAS